VDLVPRWGLHPHSLASARPLFQRRNTMNEHKEASITRWFYRDEPGNHHMITCSLTGGCGATLGHDCETKEEVSEKWNRRPSSKK